jgi:hypothetical protein
LLKKPFAFERFLHNPVQQERINLRTNGLHQIARQTVPCFGVDVKHPETRIETEG